MYRILPTNLVCRLICGSVIHIIYHFYPWWGKRCLFWVQYPIAPKFAQIRQLLRFVTATKFR